MQCSIGYTIYANRYLNEQYKNYCIETDENGCLAPGKEVSCEYLGVANVSGGYNSAYFVASGTDYDDLVASTEALVETDYGYFICRHCTKRVYRIYRAEALASSQRSEVTILKKKKKWA